MTEATEVDGIVPLQATSTAPNALVMVRNSIVSENAEVLFDPIVPLPSPSKVRPKLRLVTRLPSLRRNSVQGSASESEDERRRALPDGCGPSTSAPQQRQDSHTTLSTIPVLPNSPDKDEIKVKKANEKDACRAAKESEGKAKDSSGTKANTAPVPQIKLGPNGEIILDEKSLVIKQSEKRTIVSSTVHEGSSCNTSTVGCYRRTPRSNEWSDAESVRFYRALAALGTDFTIMEHLFPGRTRRQLKDKFKREERVNMAQVEKAIRTTVEWDPMRLLSDFTAEREAEQKTEREKAAKQQACTQERQQLKQTRRRPRLSQSAKALGSSVLPSDYSGFMANDVIEMYQEVKESKKKAPQKPRKRGGPKSNPSPPPATITEETQEPPNTQPTDDVATTRNIDSPKPQDKIPDEPPNIPGRHANIKDESMVIIPFDDTNSPSNKIFKTYIASKERKFL